MEAASLRTDEEIKEIYAAYAATVYRISLLMLKNRAEAEDATQNVFIKLMRCETKFESGEHLKAWLIVTAKNTCKDLLKSWWRKKTTGLDGADALCSSSAPDDHHVFGAVMSLHNKYRIPLYLYYYEGYSTEEIASLLTVNPSTLRSRLRTARQKLKLLLEEDATDE